MDVSQKKIEKKKPSFNRNGHGLFGIIIHGVFSLKNIFK
jgi:hypothetical protein